MKKISESAWGDMRKRSSGEMVRKEDDMTIDDIKYDIRSFVERVVYYEQYKNILYDFERFCKERWNFIDKKAKEYVEKKVGFAKRYWGRVKNAIDEEIDSENEKIKKIGFEKQPGKTIDDTLDTWWADSLDESDRMDVLYSRGCEDNYVNPSDMWGDLTWEEKMTEYVAWHPTNESAWGDMRKRSSGESVRKEDDLTLDDIKFRIKSFVDRIVYFEEYKNKIDDLEDLIERSWNLPGHKDAKEMAQKEIGYVRRNWQKIERIIDDGVNILEENIKKIGFVKKAGESPYDTLYSWWDSLDKKIQKEIIDSLEYDDYDDPKDIWEMLSWDDQMIIYVKWSNAENVIKECEGVPGGATPASVGGMGAAYFPGPDDTPGSGDLPSPTGIVYHQVAPYTMFLKQIKKKKKKSKKFRKEDEPCVHSPNAKVYDYVDDFREYVDRTYNNMDRRR